MPDHQSVDADMRDRLRAGDHAAFELLFERCSDRVYSYAWRATRDRLDAEDVMSLVFLECWRTRDKAFTSEGRIDPWVFAVATNVLKRRARAARRHSDAMKRLQSLREPPSVDPASIVVEQDAADARARDMAAAIERMTPRERQVFQLRVVEQFSEQQAAAILGVSVGTIKSRLSRARERLGRTGDVSEPRGRIGDSSGERRLARLERGGARG